MCPLWPRLHGPHVSGLATPPNLVRDLSATWPPANVSALSRLRFQTLSTMCLPCVRLVLVLALSPLRPASSKPCLCPPFMRRVCLESALAASPRFLRHVSALYQPCVGLVAALAVFVRLVSAVSSLSHVSAMCLPCAPPGVCFESSFAATLPPALCPPCACQLRSTMCPVSAQALALPLDFVRSWGRVVAAWSKNSFSPLRSLHVYIACALISFVGIHFGYPNSAFASAPYAWKTVWGLCSYIYFFILYLSVILLLI